MTDVTECQSFPRPGSKSIEFQTVYAHNGCVNVFEGQNCTGKYIPKYPIGIGSAKYRETYNFSWMTEDNLRNNLVGSLGPCETPCQLEPSRPEFTSNLITLFGSNKEGYNEYHLP